MAAIVASHLQTRATAASSETNEDAAAVSTANPITVTAGFDSRHSSPDIFAGVLDGLRLSGTNVVDAGRCTAASLLHTCQREPDAAAAILVTGAGAPAGHTGMDFFLANGQELSVPWQKFGVSIRRENQHADFGGSESNPLLRRAIELIPQKQAGKRTAAYLQNEARLVFPASFQQFGDGFRSGRRSGSLRSVDAERHYREWLKSWWPTSTRIPIRIASAEPLIAERISWLDSEHQLTVQMSGCDSDVNRDTSDTHQLAVQIQIGEDDRFLSVRNRRGQELRRADLADWLNHSDRTRKTHVTAHASDSDDRIFLVDVAAPGSGRQYRVISDGLAVTGFILSLMNEGSNPLPN